MSSSIKKIKQKTLFSGFFNLRLDHFVDKNQKIHEYMCLESLADGVVVLAELEPEKFIILEEFRYPVEKKILSLPGGRVNPHESPLEGAKREFLEETGFEAKEWSLLGQFYPFPSASDQKIWVFQAKDLKKTSSPDLDPLEILSCLHLTFKEILALSCKEAKLDSTIAMAMFLKLQNQHNDL
jgi:ADP-ribose pyrophosphatase